MRKFKLWQSNSTELAGRHYLILSIDMFKCWDINRAVKTLLHKYTHVLLLFKTQNSWREQHIFCD